MPRRTTKILTMKLGGFSAMSHLTKSQLKSYVDYKAFERQLPRSQRFKPFYSRK